MAQTDTPTDPPAHPPLRAQAILLGRHLDPRGLALRSPQATNPPLVEVPGGGQAVLLRSGALVLFGVAQADECRLIERLAPFVSDPLPNPEVETLEILLAPGRPAAFDQGRLVLAQADPPRLQVIASVLGKSVLLAEQEARVASTFERIEPLAEELQSHGRGAHRAGGLIRHIGETLLIQHRMVARGEVGDKPDILWEHPELEGLFLLMEGEYEIRERQLILERKLELINATAGTLLDLLQSKRSLRVEWYIVILIVVEILLTLYELFIHGRGVGA
ncbi:RMD1 family protein [Thiococcus pfennigii]|uniref:RMD1 family protein n=1 Tax=Thiococcus pfennigii TaxID=1057 RepID=UPI001902CD08|nr:RMD1 family protein [Thiococcus pfennigii]MBK1701521.1 hypothetical protein [Thiococcus pfennigii]